MGGEISADSTPRMGLKYLVGGQSTPPGKEHRDPGVDEVNPQGESKGGHPAMVTEILGAIGLGVRLGQ